MAADIEQLLRAALQRHRAGDLHAAEGIYRRLLETHPDHPDALNLLAALAMDSGRCQEAVDLLRRAVAVADGVAQFHVHLGNALQGIGDFDAAAHAYRKALSLNPKDADAQSALGFALTRLGRLPEAIASLQAALAIEPRNFFALNNLGDALTLAGDPGGAARVYAGAVTLSPGIAELHTKLGRVLRDQGRQMEALAQLWAAAQSPDAGPQSYRTLGAMLRFSRPDGYDPELERCLLAFFQAPEVDHGDAAEFATALIKFKYADVLAAGGAPDAAFAIHTLLADPLPAALLGVSANGDADLERLLTAARRELLLDTDEPTPAGMHAAALLARQCIINEYVLAAGDAERNRLETLAAMLDSHTGWESGSDPRLQYALLRFAMYAPLWKLKVSARLAAVPLTRWHPDVALVVQRSLLEHLEERALEERIPSMGRTRDAVSRRVKDQYEENPYPRWIVPAYRNPGNLRAILARLFPAFEPPPILEGAVRVLVVGCGTGHHPISIALRYENATVLATDISRRSLAYAVRMACVLGVSNVEFVENDLLNLAELQGEFQVIECVGVLHHTASVSAGLDCLLGKLHPRGVLKIGLYSARARAPVAHARERIAALGLTPGADDIRRFRQMALAAGADDPLARLPEFGDFYTLSSCRDLLFHAHEQTLGIADLRDLLDAAGLRFIGFESVDAGLGDAYRQRFPGDGGLDNLDRWEAVERDAPGLFAGLYQFWCTRR